MPAIRQVVPPEQLNQIWFQQDGCPAHNARIVSRWLNENFDNRVISNSGPTAWPARSPDLSPLDFFLWGLMKNTVYDFEPPENINILEERVRDAFNNINRNTLGRATTSVLRRCQNCVQQNGQHFEHL